MSFESDASIVLNGSPDEVFEQLSRQDKFKEMVLLSSSAHSIDINSTDIIYLKSDLTYDIGPSDGERCDRIHFKLIEHVKYCGITISVTVLGTHITSHTHKLHLYESSANNGAVKIRKVRRFLSHQGETLVDERISGQTSWIMKGFVSRECRSAHNAHVARYGELLSD